MELSVQTFHCILAHSIPNHTGGHNPRSTACTLDCSPEGDGVDALVLTTVPHQEGPVVVYPLQHVLRRRTAQALMVPSTQANTQN